MRPPVLHSARHRRLLDAGTVALVALGAFLALGPSRPVLPTEAPAWWWVDLAGAVATGVALLARRRHPVAVALGVLAVAAVSTAAWLASAVALFGLAARRPWRVAVAVAVLSWVIAPLKGALRALTPENTSASSLAWAVGVTVLVLLWGVAVRTRHELVDSLVERAETAEAEAALRAEAARAAERTRIAREMHDVLAHRLSLVSLHAGALAHRRHPSPQEVHDALEVIRDGARDALCDLRAILGVLRGPDGAADVESATAAPQPTLADLPRLLDDVRAAGTEVRLHDERAAGAVPEACGRTLYRVTQEALTNAVRHAPSRPIDVTLRGAPGGDAELEITNPLPAAPGTTTGAGTGLLGVTERVGLAGGRVLARGPEDGRFRVAVRVPWTAP